MEACAQLACCPGSWGLSNLIITSPALHCDLASPTVLFLFFSGQEWKDKTFLLRLGSDTCPSPLLPARIHSRGCKGSPFALVLWDPLLFLVIPQDRPSETLVHTSWSSLPPLSTTKTKAHASLTRGVSTPRYILFVLFSPRWCLCQGEGPPDRALLLPSQPLLSVPAQLCVSPRLFRAKWPKAF